MPTPVYTSDTQFADYLVLAIGRGVVTDLSIEAIDLQVVAEDAVLDYGVADITSATNIRKLRAMGKVRAWEWVANEYVAQYRIVVESETADRQQKWEHAKAMQLLAKADLAEIVRLELEASEAAGGFDIAEQILDDFGARQHLHNQVLRGAL